MASGRINPYRRTSLTFETKVKNTGTVDIRNKFDIDLWWIM